jgi:hypothetical protein
MHEPEINALLAGRPTNFEMAERARTVCAVATMFALTGYAVTASNPYAGPAYADADAGYYPGYVGVSNPYVYGPYWDGYGWHQGWQTGM